MKTVIVRTETMMLEMEIIEKILHGLNRSGMSQRELAKRLDISAVHMCNLLAGRNRFTLDVALTALRLVSCDLTIVDKAKR